MIQENNKKDKAKDKVKKVKKAIKNEKIAISKFKNLEGKFLHVRVGTPEEPAIGEQIEDIEKKIVALFEKNKINCLAFVTHHAVSMEIVEK